MDQQKMKRPEAGRGSLLAGVAIILVVVGVMVFFLANSSRKDAVGVDGNAPSPLTPEVFKSITDELEDRVGSTAVFSIALFPEHAVIEVPVDGHSERYESLVWRGGFSEFSKGTSGARRFDMRQVNSNAFQRLLDDAASRLDLVDDQRINIAGAEYDYNYPRMIVSVDNDYGETSSLIAHINGRIIERGQ